MDAVYILGSGSEAANEEIRYSVRALCQHMLDLESVYIVGEDPGFLPGAIHIPAEDPYDEKWRNAFYKTQVACVHPDISDEFILMNDDFFPLTPFMGAELDFYALKNSDGGPNGPHFFGVHLPIRLNKEYYLNMPLRADMKGTYSPRSFYGNFYKAPPRFISDVVVRPGPRMPSLDDQIRGLEFFSISNGAMLDDEFREWLAALYPLPSPLESA